MTVVLAVDLDQTLIFSRRSAEPLEGAETVWVEDYLDAPLSLMTVVAHRLLAALQERHQVVPVTTRTPAQFARVRLPHPAAWAIVSNGGVLLRDGVRDAGWDTLIAEDLAAVAPAAEAYALLAGSADQGWVRTCRQVEELFAYLVAEHRDLIPDEWLLRITAWATTHGWTVSVQGRKVYLVPVPLSKGRAASRVAEQLDGVLLAAGDSLLDRDLLEAAVFAIRPAHGELHRLGYLRAQVTSRSGACAAEDVLKALADQADLLRPHG